MTLAFNAFKDPCSGLAKKQAQFCKGFDYGAIERRKATEVQEQGLRVQTFLARWHHARHRCESGKRTL